MVKTKNSPILDRILAWSLDRPLSQAQSYLAATCSIALIAVVRVVLITSLLPWLLFIPAILAISLIFGQQVGVYACLLATVAAALTIGDLSRPAFLSHAQWGGSWLFLIVTVLLARVVGELRDVFERARHLNVELEERERFLSSVLGSSTDCIKVIDLDGRLTFMTEGGMKVMEISDFNEVKGCPWPDFWQDEGNADARNAIDTARNGKTSQFMGKADTRRGTPKWWAVSVSPILDVDGRPTRILAVSRDMTALMEAQEQQRLLNGELGHRLKNVLALVQSIANQTFRRAESIEEANAAFASRLVALGQATEVLTSAAWQSATLNDVVMAGLASVGDAGDRVERKGPPVNLDSQVALALTLALHELTTNACKYGALSNDYGRVSLRWHLETVENTGVTRFRFVWQEIGGPIVIPPTSKGFGSKMIERSLRSYFRGETALSFKPEGVEFRIDAPLPSAGAA